MNYEFLQCELENAVAVVTINRPPVNPLSSQVFKELYDLLFSLDSNNEVKAVIITGSY